MRHIRLISAFVLVMALAGAPRSSAQILSPLETIPEPCAGASQAPECSPQASSITVAVTVGLSSSCAATDSLTVGPGTRVFYCFKVTNTGTTTLTRHTLVDNRLGTVLNNFPFTLVPEATAFLTSTTIITQTTINSATWTAFNPGPTDTASASDGATVSVQRSVYLPLLLAAAANRSAARCGQCAPDSDLPRPAAVDGDGRAAANVGERRDLVLIGQLRPSLRCADQQTAVAAR